MLHTDLIAISNGGFPCLSLKHPQKVKFACVAHARIFFKRQIFSVRTVHTLGDESNFMKIFAVLRTVILSTTCKAGACGFGIGTKFEDDTLLKTKNFAAITEVVRAYVELAASL